MLRMDIRYAKPDMVLALPVRHTDNAKNILLKANYTLTDKIIGRLPDMGIRYVWVHYPALSFVEEFVSQEVMQTQGEMIGQIGSCFESIQKDSAAKVPYHSYTETIGRMVDNLVSNPKAAVFMGDIAEGKNNDMMRHGSNVAYLSLLMGLKLEGYIVKQRKHINPAQAKEMTQLGVGGMLHDIGIMELPEAVREKYEETGDETDADWQEHPDLGFRKVRGNIEPSAATVVLNHHQAFNGSGYAGKSRPVLQGERIHIFARIAAAAEFFDRLRFPVAQAPRSTVEALLLLQQWGNLGKFDQRVLRALFTVVPPYPPGSLLRLSDGRWATTVDHVPSDPCRPVVQIIPDPSKSIPKEDDEPEEPPFELASCTSELYIAECDGIAVGEHNFEPPAFMTDEMLALNWF